MRVGLLLAQASLAALSGASAQAALAQLSSNSVQVGARVASFQLSAMRGQVTAAIVFDPDDPASEAEARTIERTLANGLTVGALRLKPKRVAEDDLGELAGARVAFVTKGVNYRNVARSAEGQSILTISSDIACVNAGYCAVAISSGPKVQIFVSREACGAASIRFSAAFLMLVKEI